MAGRISSGTERAIQRVAAGQSIRSSAIAEDIDPSTLFRALRRRREDGTDDTAKPRIVIVGAGALGREIAQWARRDGADRIVFLDDTTANEHVIGTVESYERLPGDEVLIAIADPKARQAVAGRIQAASFIAASVTCGDCSIGLGSLLLPHALVSAAAVLGEGCILNTYSSIGHDVVVGDYCTFSSYVCLAGRVKVGNRVMFGTGAKVLPGVSIGDDAIVGAGAVVVKDVPDSVTVFGVPARIVVG
jgi:sugar O-acyltransferase (sialic acid O-acetyltransferase NeuD family)